MKYWKVTLQNGEVRFKARITIDGRKPEISAPTLRELTAIYEAAKAKQRRQRVGLPQQLGPITFSALADKFMAQYQYSPRSKRTLTERLTYPRASFGDVLVRDITRDTVAAWNARIERAKPKKGQDKLVSATTRHNALRAARQVFDYGIQSGYLEANPAKIKAPGPAKRIVKPFESWADVFTAADKAGDYGPLIRFACATGLRPQEWQALEWRHIDFNARELRVEQTIREGKIEAAAKTEGSLRTVKLQAIALDALRDLTSKRFAGGLIFQAPEGGQINLSNFRRRAWTTALADAKIEYRAVDNMRHTFATLGLAAGAPVEWISKQLGHTNIQTTLKHYARWLPAADARNLAVLDAFAVAVDPDGRKVDGTGEATDAQ